MLNASQEGADGIQYRQDRDLVSVRTKIYVVHEFNDVLTIRNNQLSTQKEGEVNVCGMEIQRRPLSSPSPIFPGRFYSRHAVIIAVSGS